MKQTLRSLAIASWGILLLTSSSVVAQVEMSISEPMEWSDVAAPEQGVVTEICVKVGQLVTRGEIIAKLDCQDLEQSIVLAKMKAGSQAKTKAAEAQVKLKQSQHDNLISLAKGGHSNPAEIAQSSAQLEHAEAELLAAQEQKQQDQQEVQRLIALRDRRYVRSPIDGFVTEVHRRSGEFVSSNEPRLATIVNLEQLRARFYLFTNQIESLKVGQPLKLHCGEHQVPSMIEFISPITDPKTGLSRVDILIENRQLAAPLRSGTPCHWPNSITKTVSQTNSVSGEVSNRAIAPRHLLHTTSSLLDTLPDNESNQRASQNPLNTDRLR